MSASSVHPCIASAPNRICKRLNLDKALKRVPVFFRPGGRANAGAHRAGSGVSQGLRLDDADRQAAVLAASENSQPAGKLGLVYYCADAPDQGGILSFIRGQLPFHGADEKNHAADANPARAIQRRPAENECRVNGALQNGKGQSLWRMFAGFNPDSRVYRLVLGIARLRGNARRALAWLDSGFIQARSLFYSAGVDDRDNVYPDTPESDAA